MPSPLDGRKFWIAGIGGAGMSAYALLARAWGAEVRGWDRTSTAYLEQLAGIDGLLEPQELSRVLELPQTITKSRAHRRESIIRRDAARFMRARERCLMGGRALATWRTR